MVRGTWWMLLCCIALGALRSQAVISAAPAKSVAAQSTFLPFVSKAVAPSKPVLAFYYPWYDQNTWNDPVVIDYPLDRYNSSDPAVMTRQIRQAKGANIDAFVSAWYGPTVQFNQTETNLRTLLTLAEQQNFSMAVQFETTGPFFATQDDVKNALSYLLSVHATNSAYLKWKGKPVIFFWAQSSVPRPSGQSALATWQAIRSQVDPNHNTIWLAEGFDMSLLGVFDGDYLYNIAWSNDVGATERQWAANVRAKGAMWVGTVMPGWDDTRLTERPNRFKRERQNGVWYQQTWSGAASANPEWIVITSWNEFVENTYIEPSVNYGAQYLDLTRALAGNWKSGALTNARLNHE